MSDQPLEGNTYTNDEAMQTTAPSCLCAREPDTDWEAGEVVGGRYRLIALIGRGGMGAVWLAEHLVLHTRVAIKVSAIPRDENDDDIGRRGIRERMCFEAQIASQLSHKTGHIVNVYEIGLEARRAYLVMELVEGRTLAAWLDGGVRLTLPRVARILTQIADALCTAHAAGILHRDVKPQNILLVNRPDGVDLAKLLDFGVARARRTSLDVDVPSEPPGWVVGTPEYMSPEQFQGGDIDETADLWGLAVCAYEALVGCTPFAGETIGIVLERIMRGGFTRPSKLRFDLPTAIDGWFERAFDPDPKLRFRSARHMTLHFAKVVAMSRRERVAPPAVTRPSGRSGSSLPMPAPPRRSLRHLGVRLALLSLGVLLLSGYVLWSR